jgi:PAS domain S-box-containing protein
LTVRPSDRFTALVAASLLSARSDALIAADRDGVIGFWNPGAERIFGFSSDEAVGRSLDLIIPERLRARHWDGYRRVMATGKSRYGEGEPLAVPALRKDGATISIEFTVTALCQGDETVGMAAVIRDVTVRFNEMRALKRAIAEKSRES